MLKKVRSGAERVKNWCRSKDRKYWKGCVGHWLIAAVLIFVGLHLGEWLGEQHYWVGLRYRLYDSLTQTSARPAYNSRTALVLIGDDEYWKGEPAGRAPIKRSYLAKLVRAVGAANPAVVGLDFIMRSPTPDGSPVPYRDYDAETRDFLKALHEAAAGSTTVVIPKSLGGDEHGYFTEHDFYDGLVNSPRIRTGYIELDDDLRRVPLELELKDKSRMDSFALAIVRAAQEKPPLPAHDNNSMPYGSFMRPEEFLSYTASEVLAADKAKLTEMFAHKVVIIGGSWRGLAHARGNWIDSFETPVGQIPGAYIHANYVEALMASRVSAPVDAKVNKGIEIVFSLVIATVFFVPLRTLWKMLIVSAAAAALLFISYFSWQNLGLYFDFFIPTVLLGLHFVVEHWLHRRKEARELRGKVEELSRRLAAATTAPLALAAPSDTPGLPAATPPEKAARLN